MIKSFFTGGHSEELKKNLHCKYVLQCLFHVHSEGPVVLPHVWFYAYLILTESKSKKTLTWFAWFFNDT